MEEKSVMIKRADKGINVVFDGVWTRSDVDGAYRAMILELPKHLFQLRQRGTFEAKGDENGRTNGEESRGREEGEGGDGGKG